MTAAELTRLLYENLEHRLDGRARVEPPDSRDPRDSKARTFFVQGDRGETVDKRFQVVVRAVGPRAGR